MSRLLTLAYGIACYVVFLGTFLYAIGFVGNVAVPKSIDSGPVAPYGEAILLNLALLGLFGLQHSVMARPGFKRWWTRLVPRPVERSTYVLFASLALILTFAFWRHLPDMVWTVQSALGRGVLWAFFALGWGIVLVSTFMISHAHLFGLEQVREHADGKGVSEPRFQTPGLYRHVRHPIMLGFFIAFWATPDMSAGRLLFAIVTSLYILVALHFEERDLMTMFGEEYARYRSRVPKLIPRLQASRSSSD